MHPSGVSGFLPKRISLLPVVLTNFFGQGVLALIERQAHNAQRAPALSPYETGIASLTRELGTIVRKRALDAI